MLSNSRVGGSVCSCSCSMCCRLSHSHIPPAYPVNIHSPSLTSLLISSLTSFTTFLISSLPPCLTPLLLHYFSSTPLSTPLSLVPSLCPLPLGSPQAFCPTDSPPSSTPLSHPPPSSISPLPHPCLRPFVPRSYVCHSAVPSVHRMAGTSLPSSLPFTSLPFTPSPHSLLTLLLTPF